MSGQSDLWHIIYSSHAVRPLSGDDLLVLLIECRERNALLDITGMLGYNNGMFLQILEGPLEGLTKVYSSIQTDSRHHRIKEVKRCKITERSFPDWSMRIKNMTHLSFNTETEFDQWLEKEFTYDFFCEHSNLAHNMMLSFLRSASIMSYPPFNPNMV